jgi:hypothetical protein
MCKYRNCDKEIEYGRKDKQYCDRNCKSCERKYVKREDSFRNKIILQEMEKVKQYKEMVKLLENN